MDEIEIRRSERGVQCREELTCMKCQLLFAYHIVIVAEKKDG